MTMRRIDDNQVNTGIDQSLGAGKPIIADRGGGGYAQATLFVFCRIGVQLRLFHIFNGNQTNAVIIIIDHQQFFDAVMVQQTLGFIMTDRFFHRHQIFMRH